MHQLCKKKRGIAILLSILLIITLLPTRPAFAGQTQATGGKLSAMKVTGIEDKVYTGKKLTQKPVIMDGSYQLKQNTDYTISYRDNVKIGTASVILKGKGKYTGTVTKSFKISPPKTKGEIKIPKVTDPSLTAPTDIHLGEYEKESWEGSEKIKIIETVPGLFWTNSNETADMFYIQFYDENDNLIQAGMHSPSKDGALRFTTFYSIDGGAENYTIKTIVITPVNSIDGSVNTDPASGEDKIGESTIFHCEVKVKVESGKKATITVEKIEGNNEQIRMNISEKTSSYGSYYVTCNYKDENGRLKNSGRGSNAEGSGEMIINESLKNFNGRYKNAIKITLVVYSDLVTNGADQASYTRTIHEAKIKE